MCEIRREGLWRPAIRDRPQTAFVLLCAGPGVSSGAEHRVWKHRPCPCPSAPRPCVMCALTVGQQPARGEITPRKEKVNHLLNQYLLPSPAHWDSLHFLLWGISCAENERRKEKEKRGERHVNLPCVTSSLGGEGALFIDLSHTHVIKRNFSTLWESGKVVHYQQRKCHRRCQTAAWHNDKSISHSGKFPGNA